MKTTVGDGINTAGYRFTSLVPLTYTTYIARLEYQIDQNGNHVLFWHGQMQNHPFVPSSTTTNGVPQLPGQPHSILHLENDKSIALGYTWIVTPSLVNGLQYGFARQSYDTTGVQTAPIVSFTALDNPIASTTPLTAIISMQDIEENLTWTRGALQFSREAHSICADKAFIFRQLL
jgi:hypothetical protein